MSSFADPAAELDALASFDFTGRDEAFIREQWIYPLLRLLGYGLGTIDIPFKVDLRPPVRAMGSQRWEIDYLPTVHGVGLWIIEAKRPSEDLSSEQHLGQAWGYATHPLVDVPLMVMANGERLAVHDVTQEKWEIPILDLAQRDLPERFADLNARLGARSVAEFVRQRQLRHLERALLAQLDDEALDKTIADVASIVQRARPTVGKNRAQVQVAAYVKAVAERDRTGRAAGVGGLASAVNSPHMGWARDLDLCAEMIVDRPAHERAAAFREIALAADIRGATRMTFALRLFRLGVALRLVGTPGCAEDAAEAARVEASNGAENFPADPVARSAHRFELVLAAFFGRVVQAAGTDEALAAATRLRATVDVETWLRQEATGLVGARNALMRQVEIRFRLTWFGLEPWTVEALDAATIQFRSELDNIQPRNEVQLGPYEVNLAVDPLRSSTYVVIGDVAGRTNPVSAGRYSDESHAFAESLLDQHFPDGPEATPTSQAPRSDDSDATDE